MLENKVDKRVKARRRMRGIAVFFIVISVIGSLSYGILYFTDYRQVSTEDLLGQAIFLGALLISALATWNGSRFAAIMVILLLSFTFVFAFFDDAGIEASDIGRHALYFVLAVMMAASAFRYHKLSKAESLAIGGSQVIRWGGKILAVSVSAFLGLGLSILYFGNGTSVLRGSEISQKHLNWLSENELLLFGEQPLFFYLDGVFSPDEGGSLLTDKYAGAWWQENGELKSGWLQLGQICRVETASAGNFFEDAVYIIHGPGNGNWIELWLSIDGDMHKQFISRMRTINEREMRPEIQKFCDENRPINWVEVAAMNGISQNIVGPNDVSEEQFEWLRNNKYLNDEEVLLKFYSYGTYEIAEGGSLLTDEYFGGWYEDNETTNAWWAELGSICQIEQTDPGSDDENAKYKIVAPEDSWIELSLPARNGQDTDLIEQVQAMNGAKMTDKHRADCESGSSGSLIEASE